MRSSVIAAAFLAACAQAIKVTSPTKGQVVDLSAGFKVTFETVSSDPTTAHLFIVNMAGGGTPYSKDLGEVDLSKGSFVVTEDDIPAQKGYQFNVQSIEEMNTGILAQSQQFEVKESEKDSKSSSESSEDATTSSTKSHSASSSVTVVSSSASATASSDASVSGSSTFATATGTGTASSQPTGSSSSSVSAAAAPTGHAVAGGSLLALAVAGFVAVMA